MKIKLFWKIIDRFKVTKDLIKYGKVSRFQWIFEKSFEFLKTNSN